MSLPFEPGERALLTDRKGRRYLITLAPGQALHLHHGYVKHDDLIGAPEGTRVLTSSGSALLAFRPSLAEFILKMPRGAQVIYPKDVALILMFADIGPGHAVLEAGTGSGALTLGLLRATGERGRVVSYDVRPDFHERARANIESFLGKMPETAELRLGDVVDAPVDESFDRVVLDLPDPWRVVPVARRALRPGGVFCCYLPTVLQVHRTVGDLTAGGDFTEVSTFEGIVRPWHVEGQSIRPEHRMVAHTGFLTTARYLGRPPPEEPRRPDADGPAATPADEPVPTADAPSAEPDPDE